MRQGERWQGMARLEKLGEANIVRLSEGCEARLRKEGQGMHPDRRSFCLHKRALSRPS
jgi:hypothetical protein